MHWALLKSSRALSNHRHWQSVRSIQIESEPAWLVLSQSIKWKYGSLLVFCQSSSTRIMSFCFMILWLYLLVHMGSKWKFHFLVLIGPIRLWTCRYAAGGTFFGYIQIKEDAYKEQAHAYAVSKTHTQTNSSTYRIHIFIGSHTQTYTQGALIWGVWL